MTSSGSGAGWRFHRLVANFLGFQATWFACVGGAALGHPLLGPLVAVLWLSLHLAFAAVTLPGLAGRTGQRMVELRLLSAAAAVGYLLDSALTLAGAFAFPERAGFAAPTTPWMVALWAAFAATLRHSMNWARRRYALAAIAGAVFGPLAYRTGDALGAVSLAPLPFGWLAVAGEWVLAMPLLLWLRERFEGALSAPTDRSSDRHG